MDPIHAWKDDFSREVEEVIASRARARERGEAAPEEGFNGRFIDMVIPPAGAYAELRDALKKLELAQVEVLELRERLKTKETQFARECQSRERIKDGASRLAFMLRDERTARGTAEAEAKKASSEVASANESLSAVRLDVADAAARAEDWGRTGRELQARLNRALLDSDAQDAEMASLRARHDIALNRAQAGEKQSVSARADAVFQETLAARLAIERSEALREAETAFGRAVRAETSERAALTRSAALEAEVRALSVSASAHERKAHELAADLAKAREDAAGGQARESAFTSERARVQAESARMLERAETLSVEGTRALEKARRIEGEIPQQLEAALLHERARLNTERAAADRERELARESRRETAVRAAEIEVLLDEARVVALRDAREQGQAAYAQGLSVARAQAEYAERALEAARSAEAAASEKAKMAVSSLEEYRRNAAADLASARRAEAIAQSRRDGEVSSREAALEEDRAILRAEFEDMRAKLEDELDAERRGLRERWKEQTEALDRLKKDLEHGHPRTEPG